NSHHHYAPTSSNVFNLFHNTVSICRVQTRGGFVEKQQQRIMDDVDPNRDPSSFSSRDSFPGFLANVCMCDILQHLL
ncbi:hypothetical protein LINPERHAP2_LOCUS23615, partial [Linum perenne]